MNPFPGRFAGRVIVVTGGGRGPGLATAELLAAEGASVVAIDLAFGDTSCGAALRFAADVCDRARLEAIACEVRDAVGAVDGLATFAGIARPGGIEDVAPEDWRRVLDVNVVGSANAVAAFLPDLSSVPGASVVLCSSQVSLGGARNCVAYAASKGAINAMCRCLAVDHADSGIRVNAVAPGPGETSVMARASACESPGNMARTRAQPALGRFGTAGETAAAAAFLLSEEASFITGTVLPVDGGWSFP
ncbi:SDR family NAD(P)-dependent oxidoreductase [Acuticoccus sediminis]|uniref:SDR family NAD(P)-dependent oxidoreductase n=1 Tax=Acuticoccus sediminis TaxID=2184697 RepID=UPI001CFD5D25|nr:SDR family oxidoreductase [Acuticoccus sediminis]